jgi:hypothetical protein
MKSRRLKWFHLVTAALVMGSAWVGYSTIQATPYVTTHTQPPSRELISNESWSRLFSAAPW